MNDTDAVWTAVRRKRVVRRFADRPLERDHLTRIIDAGRHACLLYTSPSPRDS